MLLIWFVLAIACANVLLFVSIMNRHRVDGKVAYCFDSLSDPEVYPTDLPQIDRSLRAFCHLTRLEF